MSQAFGVAFIIVLSIMLTVMMIRTLGQAAVGQVSAQDVVLLLGYVVLGHLPTMLTLSLFLAVVSTLSRMYRDSEMAVWFASGISEWRVLRSVLRWAFPVLVAVLLLEMLVWPWGNRHSAEVQQRFERRSDLSRVAPGQFQSSRDGQRVFFIDRDTQDDRIARNVFIVTQSKGREAVTTAHEGRIEWEGDSRYLVLQHGQRNEWDAARGDAVVARFDEYRVLADRQVMRERDELPPKAQPTLQLLREQRSEQRGELAWRMGIALAAANLVLIGVALSPANPRRSSNWNLLSALLAFVVYFNLVGLTQRWVGVGRYGLVPTLLTVHLLALALPIGLIALRAGRNGWRWPWLRRASGVSA